MHPRRGRPDKTTDFYTAGPGEQAVVVGPQPGEFPAGAPLGLGDPPGAVDQAHLEGVAAVRADHRREDGRSGSLRGPYSVGVVDADSCGRPRADTRERGHDRPREDRGAAAADGPPG